MAKSKKKKVSTKKAAPRKAKPARKISAKKAKARASANPREALLGRNHRERKMSPFTRFTVECQSQLEKQNKMSRVRQSVTSLFGLTDDEGGEGEEEEATPAAETKE